MSFNRIHIILNGLYYECCCPMSLDKLFLDLKKDPTHHIVEYNGNLLERSEYKSVVFSQGDRVEIIAFVGGGSSKVALQSSSR